ncbi:MAG: serine acetyltransferase [Candidatus Scalindua sp.]|nr:serine acetyltransferase [Candidatus Scalindua sp.]
MANRTKKEWSRNFKYCLVIASDAQLDKFNLDIIKMIKSRKDLKHYLQEDGHRAGITNSYIYFAKLVYGNEQAHALRYLKILRRFEYHHNLGNSILRVWYRIRHSRLGLKYGIHIGINTVGYGFWIPHFVGEIIIGCKSMGNYCSANGGVIVGNSGSDVNIATIGNYVKLSVGCKVYGKIDIGSHVIIAPNSVVYQSVPSHTVVAGNPANVIKTGYSLLDIYYFDKQ